MKHAPQLMLCSLVTFGAIFLGGSVAVSADEQPGRVRDVTLYRNRALVTRVISVPAGEAVRSVMVPDLPETILSDSVHAVGEEGTVVRAVRVFRRPLATLPREVLQQLDQEIKELSRARVEIQHGMEMVSKDLETLSQMVLFSANAGKSDLDRGVLKPDTLTTLTTFVMTRRRELAAERFRHQTELVELKAQLLQVQSKRRQATQSPHTSPYQTQVFVETPNGAAGTVRLNYLVTGCGWSPQYTVRGVAGKNRVGILYSALVVQSSGEAWEEVNLVLSTASPSVSAARPLLTSLEVKAVAPSTAGDEEDLFEESSQRKTSAGRSDSLADMVKLLRDEQRQAEITLNGELSETASETRDLALNAVAGQIQQIELQAESQSWRYLAPDARGDVASHVYTLPRPISLATRQEQQVVNIVEFALDGEMYHVATPLLSTYAYREVQMTNTQPVGLLSGPATVYLDDRFVGHAQIPSTASGQQITIGFGADLQVRTRRELIRKEEIVKGGNRQLVFGYRLVVSNFKDEDVAVRLMDRMPHTRTTQQLAVKFEPPQVAISEDPLYQRVLRPTGILRWDLTVPAGRHGSKAFDVDYRYTMEFDRSLIPTTEHSLADLKAQYEAMQLPSGGGGGFGGGFGGK